jgi:hypothetical protein
VSGITWFWPGVAVVLVMSWVLAPAVARLLRMDRRLAWLLVLTIGLVLAAEATPLRAPFGIDVTAQRPCDLGRRWFATLPEITAMGDVTLDIALYIPLGVAIALLPLSRRSAVAIAGVLALPPLIEAFQLVVPTLARGCQSGDAIDGLTGLGIGLGVGLAARLLWWAVLGRGSSTLR